MTVTEINTIEFSALKKGMKVRVLKACHDCEEGLRLQEMGLTKGAEFTVDLPRALTPVRENWSETHANSDR